MEKTNEATPWKIEEWSGSLPYAIIRGSETLCFTSSLQQAELIVKAVNAYDSLVEEVQKLKEELQRVYELDKYHYNESNKFEAENQKLREALDAMKWISVKDRLPEAKTQVLVYWLDCVEIGYLTIPEDKRFTPYWRDSGDEQPCYAKINESAVTHWMPLPEHPKAT
jgi:hypothetical protein